MSRKTRKLMWSVPLIAAVAVIGALAIFAAQPAENTQAHDLDMPGIVMDVTAEAKGRDTIDVSWKAPASGGAPDYYRIDRSENGDSWMRLVEMHTGSTSYTDMYKLKPGKPYHYRVFAVNSAGIGESSDTTAGSMATTDDAERPGVVRMLTGKAMGPNQIDLSWYPPEDDGGSPITRYCISTAGTGGTLPLPDETATPPNFGAENACMYTTPPTGNDAVSGVSVGLTAIRAANGAGVIVIRAPEGDGKVSYMHKRLVAQTERQYEVYAVNEKGFSTVATAIAPRPQTDAPGKPGKPTLRAVATATAGTVNLFWTWPADNGGSSIVNFDVDTKAGSDPWDSADGEILAANDDVTAAGLTDTAAQDDQTITGTTSFRVRANNGTEDSDWSNIVTVKYDGTAFTVEPPPAVADLAATSDGNTPPNGQLRQIDLTWTDAQNTSFYIDFRKGATGSWMVLQGNTGYTRSTYNHRNLDPDTDTDNTNDYEYRLFPFRNGAYGAPHTAVVEGSTTQATEPPAVRNVRTSSDDPTMIKVQWGQANGGWRAAHHRLPHRNRVGWHFP